MGKRDVEIEREHKKVHLAVFYQCFLHTHLPVFLQNACGDLVGAKIVDDTDFTYILAHSGVTGQWHYSGAFQAFSSIARTEGMRGLYRGVGPTMQRAALLNAAQIPSYDHSKCAILESGLLHEGIACNLVSSMTAGFVTAVVMSPIDLIKTRSVS